jgi:hypothetical protein
MASNDGSADSDESPWTKPWFIASGIVVALIVILGLVLAVVGPGSGGGSADTPSGAPAAPAPATSETPTTAESACELPRGDQAIPTSAPDDARWKLTATIAVPTAPDTFGPKTVDNKVPSCFARSPTGALFAAINIEAALSVAATERTPQQVRVLRQLVADGPGRDAAIASLRRDGPSTGSSAGVQVAGFSVVRYEEGSAVIDLAFRVDRPGAAGYVHATSTMRWERGDWKIVFTQAGKPFDSLQQIGDLVGYVAWSGV